LFVAESSASALTTYALPSLTPGDGFPTGTSPRAVAVSPDGTQTWVANGASDFVSVFTHDPALFPFITSTSGSSASIAAGPLTASLTDADFPEVTFSFREQTTRVETTLSADDQTGLLSGWNVTLQASTMVWTSPGGTVDANRNIGGEKLTVFAANAQNDVTTLSGDDFVGGAVSRNSSLGSAVSVLFTEAGNGSGSYTVPLTLSLYVPGNSATGTYTGTLTTTISAAP
jgi:DNA-binding beta-propeller fold protein YncE